MVGKVSVIVFLICSIFFCACSGGTQEPPLRAEVDSQVNARVNALQLQMQAKNDSIINAMAKHRADSVLATMKGQTATTPQNGK
jgi:hypothetical protein